MYNLKNRCVIFYYHAILPICTLCLQLVNANVVSFLLKRKFWQGIVMLDQHDWHV